MATKSKGSKATKADEAMAEVREKHAELREHWRHHNRTEIEGVVGTDEGDLSVRTVDSRLFLTVGGCEAVLDRQGVIELRRLCEQAFQAVS